MKVYIDSDYKCHVHAEESYREYEVSYFDNKCSRFICGHKYIPDGESMIDSKGTAIYGETIFPYIDSKLLREYQESYDESQAVLNATLSQIEEALGI